MSRWKFSQAPGERKRYSMDYSAWLDLGETLTDVTFVPDTVTVPSLVADGTQISPDALSVVFYVSGGVALAAYKLLVTATTIRGQVKEDVVHYSIHDPLVTS